MRIRLLFFLTILVLLSACDADYNLQREIDRAVKAGATELIIPAGRYVIDETILLDGVKNLTIKAENPGDVIISSGIEISLSDFTCLDAEKRLYEITLPELISDPWPDSFRGYAGWPEVYIHDNPFHLARWPNEGWAKIDSVIERGSIPREADSAELGGRFQSKELALALIQGLEVERQRTKVEKAESQVTNPDSPIFLSGYWCYKWYDESMRVESIDYETGEVSMAAPHRYGIGGPSGGLFYGINVPGFLDEDSEYYFDRETGTIRMILPERMDENPMVQIGYRDFTLMDIQNCQNVQLEGIMFKYHNGLAVNVLNSDSVEIRHCEFRCLAQSAVEISGGKNCGVHASIVACIGATGISLDGGDRSTLTPAHHYVTKSNIYNFARHIKTYAPGVKLAGVGQIVRGNRFRDAPHNAILFTGNDHLIENNDIKRVCWDTSDAGAIYCGRDWTMGGTVIQNNTIKDLGQASHHHNWAIYLDDLVSGIDILNNIIDNCPSGILVGGGRYNRVIGNKITNCPKASIMYDGRGLNWYTQYIDDPDNELWQRLWAMPITESPWKDRFPWLQEIKDDEPGVPKYVTILDNEIINSAVPAIHPAVKEFGTIQGW